MSAQPNRPLSFILGLVCLILYFVLSGPLAKACVFLGVIFMWNANRKD